MIKISLCDCEENDCYKFQLNPISCLMQTSHKNHLLIYVRILKLIALLLLTYVFLSVYI